MALDNLIRLRYFIAFAESSRIASVAALYDVNESSVSRALKSLQEESRVPLFASKGRKLELTSFGWSFYQKVKPTLQALDEVYEGIQKGEEKIEGTIRISTASGFASTGLIDLLDRFRRFYPKIHFETHIGHGVGDLIAGKVDVATVTNPQNLSKDLILLERGLNHYLPVASPDFISAFGPFNRVEDLVNVRIFAYKGGERESTKFLYKGGHKKEAVGSDYFYSDDLWTIKLAALKGKGVAIDLPYFFCADEVRKGKLIPILDGWQKPVAKLYTVLTKQHWKIPRFRVFAEWFSEECKKYYSGR